MAGVSKASTEYASTAKPAPQSILIVGAGVFGCMSFPTPPLLFRLYNVIENVQNTS